MDFFTHLFLESALVWLLIGYFGRQTEFLSSPIRKLSFWLIMGAAIAPDFDIFVPNAHRLYTHSLMFPLLFVLVGIILWVSHQPKITYIISWAMAFQWACHLLLDLGGFPPMGIFWPLSPLCFALTFQLELVAGVPIIRPLVFAFTPNTWIAWGQYVFGGTNGTYPFGVPLLALGLFLITVGRDFWFQPKSQVDTTKDLGHAERS